MRNAIHLMKRMLLWALVLCLLLTGGPLPVMTTTALAESTPTDGMVRVFLSSLGNPATLNLTLVGSYSLDGTTSTAIASGSQLTVNFNAATGALTLTRNGITNNMGAGFMLRRHDTTGDNGVRISQARTNNLYPGSLEFRVAASSSGYKLYTIAHVYIEEYLYGVLPYEMGSSAPLESLKAQCVSARTYTLRAMESRTANIYDVVDTTNDQVYNGTPSGSERCKQAVDETRGLVLKHGAGFAATYYTASNGGQVDAVSNVWGSAEYDYVRVKDDPFDYANKDAQVRSFGVVKNGAQSSQALAQLLVNKAKSVFGATNVSILSVDNVLPHTPRYPIPSRLYTKLSFDVTASCDGVTKVGTLTFDIFSELEGALNMSINSSNNEMWSVVNNSVGYTVQARRFGHGTGMSQRGAMLMGEMGYTFDQILAFYFEGGTLAGYAFVKTIMSPLISGASSEIATTMQPVDASACATGTAIVTLSSHQAELALRMGASAGADVIMGIPHGAVVTVHAVEGDWRLVSFGEMSGYVHKDALAVSGKADGKTVSLPTLEAYGVVNNGSYLNLRTGAGTDYNVAAEIPTGTVLPLLDVNGDWAYTQYGCETGYVSMDYITRTERYTGPAGDGDHAGAQVTAAGGTKLYATATLGGYSPLTLPEGVIVKVKYTDGSWAEVYYAGVTGFVPVAALRFNTVSVEEIKDQPTGNEQYAIVASDANSLNMRDAASMAGNVMMEIPRGETVIVTSEHGEWYGVRYRGMNGYCMAKYLSVGMSGEDDGAAETLLARVTTESGSLNLRKSASKNASIMTTIPRNTVIPVLNRGLTWSQVTYNGKTGYVMNEYLTFGVTDDTQGGTTTPPPSTPPTTPPVTDDTQLPSKAKVTTASGSLNLRKRASSGADILARIPQYTVIDVLDIEGTWTKVTYKGETGYVMSAFLTYLAEGEGDTTPPPTDAPVTQTQYARVTTASGSLNLRKRASTSAGLISRIPQNEVIPVVEKLGTWTKVTYNGDTGYVMTTFLTFIENSDAIPPEEDTTPPADGDINATLMAQVTTEKGSLNLRKRPSSSASILTTIPQYAYIQVLERGDSWSKVTFDGYTGYVMSSFLTFVSGSVTPGTPVQPDDQVETPWARVTTESGSLNLRSRGSSSAKILDTIPRHTIISVLEKGAVWSQVSYDGQTGYVKNSFLTFLHTHPDQGNAGGGTTVTPSAPNDMRDPTLTVLPSPVTAQALPASASIQLKAGCSEQADDLATILRGEYVVVSARGESWSRIEYEGVQGYLPTANLGF